MTGRLFRWPACRPALLFANSPHDSLIPRAAQHTEEWEQRREKRERQKKLQAAMQSEEVEAGAGSDEQEGPRRRPTAAPLPLAWTSPVGLPIIQPYRRNPKQRQVATRLQSMMQPEPRWKMAVHKMRQRTAFPPNYIHSLDSAHMVRCVRSLLAPAPAVLDEVGRRCSLSSIITRRC